MLGQRDRWMHTFVLSQEPDWNEIREWLERPFANTVRAALDSLTPLLNQVPGACDEAIELAQFACTHGCRRISIGNSPNSPISPTARMKTASLLKMPGTHISAWQIFC